MVWRGGSASALAVLFLVISSSATYAAPYRANAISIVDASRNRLIDFGGNDGSVFRNDPWAMSLATFEWTPLNPTGTPPGPNPKGAFYSRSTDEMIVLGASLDSVWALSLGTHAWRLMHAVGTIPPIRGSSALAFDPIRKRIMMFAGNTCIPNCILNDLWAFDLTTSHWILLRPDGGPSSPSARTGCAGTYDAVADRFLSIGGNPNGGPQIRSSNEVWSYSPATDIWAIIKHATLSNLFFPQAFIFDSGRSDMAAIDNGANWNWSTLGLDDAWLSTPSDHSHPLGSVWQTSVAFDSLMNRAFYVTADGVWWTTITSTPGQAWTNSKGTTGVDSSPAEGLSLSGAIHNPSSVDLNVALSLPDDRPATLSIHDVSGRVLRQVSLSGVGRQTVAIGAGLNLRPGVYFLNLSQGGRQVSRRAVVLR